MSKGLEQFARWLDACARPSRTLCVKRLSGNDTRANGAHQAGPYIPKRLLFEGLPTLNRPESENPRVKFALNVDSHSEKGIATAIWYNNKLRGKTRNEARITNLGGKRSALLDPESTGAIAILSFSGSEVSPDCRVWVCKTLAEEEFFAARYQPVVPGEIQTWTTTNFEKHDLLDASRKGGLSPIIRKSRLPDEWLEKVLATNKFPSTEEIAKKVQSMRTAKAIPDPDKRLVERCRVEYKLFLSVEEALVMPIIQEGFGSVDDFAKAAKSVTQRRKSRSGRSLELHVCQLLIEEGLEKDVHFSVQPNTEGKKTPDFLFPSAESYHDSNFPAESLRMLAAKTTCRDRWRQILSEASRVKVKHLITMQEGVSLAQMDEMEAEGVKLVVPEPLVKKYPDSVRARLLTVGQFIAEVRDLRARI